MPTYEYECTKCGTVFEIFQSITEPARRRLKRTDPKPCDCNAPVARRISGGGGVIFKGAGFYATDYRSASYRDAAKAESDNGKPSKDADSKPAASPSKESKSRDAAPKIGAA